jgi:hypothetical protein
VPLDPNEKLCTNWQDVKQNIYKMNERHQYMERVLRARQAKPMAKQLTN